MVLLADTEQFFLQGVRATVASEVREFARFTDECTRGVGKH